jgi:diacylglycerol kinase family enzyme
VTVPAEVEADGAAAWTGRISSVVVANGAYYGGGMKIAPAADAADGHLDLVVLGDLGRLELLWWLPTVYRGAHLACPKIATGRARRLTIRAASPLPVHVDGEPAGETPVTFEVRPGALTLRR